MSNIKVKVLFLASNLNNTNELALDEEIREITSKIRASEYRDSINLNSAWAVRPDDLIQMLNQHKPQIVHFSGHGSEYGEIILTSESGECKPVSDRALKALFTTLKDNIKVVVLNCCYSKEQAKAITHVIDCAVGMSDAIGDKAAIIFAASFYRAIGFGRSVKDAFDQGITALLLEGIPEENTPELLVKDGVNPSQVILVDIEISPSSPGVSQVYLDGSRPIIYSDRIFGRGKELEDIENLLKDQSMLVIKGFRGTGKSTLASMFVDIMIEKRKFARIYWRKVDENTDISDIISSFFTFIGKPVKDLERYKIPDQINLLFNELNEASYLLVLDNFEIILDPQKGKPLESKIDFSDLIEKANESCIRSKIVFTSWDSFASERGIRPFSYQVRGLDTSAGILLLRREGLTESEAELKKAIELSGGHTLALLLLAGLIKEGADTLSSLLNEGSLWIGEEGEVAENILNKVYNKRLSEDECKLLQYISIFRQPVPAKLIAAIANDSEWSESKVKRVALSLTRKSLLQKQLNGENYWEKSLVSKYAANRLSKKSEHHKLACEYFLSIPLPAKPAKKEDVQSLIEAHYHACMAEEYDQAFHIIFDNNLYEYLDLWGNWTVLIDLYSKLLPENHLGNGILLENKRNHGVILGNLGIAYSDLGDPRKAIEYYEQALVIDQEIGYRQGEREDLGYLGNAHRDLGDPRKVIEYHEQALVIAREIGDRRGEGNQLGNLGLAYSDLGDPRKAIEYHEQALVIDQEIGDRRGEGADLGNLGIAYSDLGDPRKAIEYYEQALIIAREIGYRLLEGNQLGNLGNAYSDLGETKKAIEHYEQALKIDKEIGDRRGEGNSLGNLGLAYRDLGETRKAIEYHEQALVIAREIGDRRREGNRLGNMGIAYRDLGDPRKAIEYYEQALEIDQEVGNRRRESMWLGNLGSAYSDLGDPRKAIEYYEQAFEINPEDAKACYYKACADSLMNKKSEALTHLKRAVELDPSYRESAKSDKDFENLWDEKDFKDIITANKED